ncbi:probable pectate lyase 12 [Oryza glaberrima]|uniref:probable pectate lyase 12 n=1 Tax=Oryza glaberrima TaxID=4538 RepID=UPI00224C3E06|nr:probable pectate lyase 12 [Oryza glaberrima]
MTHYSNSSDVAGAEATKAVPFIKLDDVATKEESGEQGPAPPPRHGAGTGGACITLQYVSNVIIHNIHIHDCVPAGNANVRALLTHYGWCTRSDGDGISLYSARDVWVDHCALSRCADGLIDALMGSTAIIVSNSYFSHHNEVMLLGHSDEYLPDSAMQVTIAFNHFGIQLVQRMPLFANVCHVLGLFADVGK